MNKKFYELNIWKKGYELLMKVYEVTGKYPPEEKYGLVPDTRRSANSVIANIAEAHGRYYFADKVRVLTFLVEKLKRHRAICVLLSEEITSAKMILNI